MDSKTVNQLALIPSANKIFKDTLLKAVEKGRSGLSTGLPFNNRLDNVLPGIQKGVYYVITALPNVGKTSIIDEMFFLNAWKEAKKQEVKVHFNFFNFEISLVNKLARVASLELFQRTGKVYDINLILSRGKNRISEELYNIVREEIAPMMDELEDYVTLINVSENPTMIMKRLTKQAEKYGTILYEEVDVKTISRGEEKSGKSKKISGFKEKDDKVHIINIVDHVGLTSPEGEKRQLKAAIDKLSEYFVGFRNTFNHTVVLLQQMNREVFDVFRISKGLILPMQNDLKETGRTVEDCDVGIGLTNPQKFNLKSYKGYDLERLHDGLRILNIFKNRLGPADIELALGYIGGVGSFYDIPPPVDKQGKPSKELEVIYNEHSKR